MDSWPQPTPPEDNGLKKDGPCQEQHHRSVPGQEKPVKPSSPSNTDYSQSPQQNNNIQSNIDASRSNDNGGSKLVEAKNYDKSKLKREESSTNLVASSDSQVNREKTGPTETRVSDNIQMDGQASPSPTHDMNTTSIDTRLDGKKDLESINREERSDHSVNPDNDVSV